MDPAFEGTAVNSYLKSNVVISRSADLLTKYLSLIEWLKNPWPDSIVSLVCLCTHGPKLSVR